MAAVCQITWKGKQKSSKFYNHESLGREFLTTQYLNFERLYLQTLHRSGSFINSLLQLEELGFRSGSPVVKKIAFIAWKSLIDNFALNPGRLKKLT